MASQGDMSTETSDAKNEVKTTPYYKVFAQQLTTAKVRAVSAGYSQMDTAWSNALSEILAGKGTAQASLNGAAGASNSALRGLAP